MNPRQQIKRRHLSTSQSSFGMASTRVVSLGIINGLLSVFGSLMNVLVTLVILQKPELQKGLNFLIVSLTAANIINCLVAQPMYIYFLSNGHVNNSFLITFELIAYIGLHAVVSNLITITYHRMNALSRPFTHLLQVSRWDLFIAIASTWIVSVIIGVVFAPSLPGRAVACYFHGLMIALLILTYIRILWVSRRKRIQIAEKVGTASYQHQAATIKQENAAAVTSAILVGTTLLCFLPDVVFDLMSWRDARDQRRIWTYTLLFSCSTLSPCIVIWRSQQLRRALLRMINIAYEQ